MTRSNKKAGPSTRSKKPVWRRARKPPQRSTSPTPSLRKPRSTPPPAQFDSLPEPALDDTPVQGTLRERMELHRKNPVCASCHKTMDPLGFALENYDAVGAWRTHEGATPVDARGAMPDGTEFDGVAGLRKALLAKPDLFVTTLTEKLMVYALGRGLESYDEPAVRSVVRSAAARQYRFSSIILGIVNSLPFQMRRAAGPPQDAPVANH